MLHDLGAFLAVLAVLGAVICLLTALTNDRPTDPTVGLLEQLDEPAGEFVAEHFEPDMIETDTGPRHRGDRGGWLR